MAIAQVSGPRAWQSQARPCINSFSVHYNPESVLVMKHVCSLGAGGRPTVPALTVKLFAFETCRERENQFSLLQIQSVTGSINNI